MLAVDTNIIVRLLVRDDDIQTAKARELIDAEDVFVPTTVLLETEWVLRGVYAFTKTDVIDALTALAGLPHVTIEDAGRLEQALRYMIDGLDFADALHLTGVEHCEAFLTFDRALVKAAKTIKTCTARLL